MFTGYITFFIAFQACCLVLATVATILNTIKLRHTAWFSVYAVYNVTIAVMTIRRIQVFVEGRPGATALDTMVWQTVIAIGFLICSSMAYALLHKK